MNAIRVGVVGLGAISGLHLETIMNMEDTELAAVCDIDPAKARIARSYGDGVQFYEDYDDMLQNARLDSVHILTPHYLHAPMVMKAARKGIAVITEKPAGIHPEEVREVIAYAREHHSKIGIVLQNRCNPTVQMAKELIGSGKAGRILCMKAFLTWNREGDYYYKSEWRGRLEKEGGGLLMNQAIHTIDLLCYFGGETSEVQGSCSARLHPGVIDVEDTAEVFLRFESGASGIFYGTNRYYENSPVRIEILCDKMTLLIENEALYAVRGGRRRKLCENPVPDGDKKYWGTSHQKLIGQFYRSFRDQTAPYIHYEEGLKSVEICNEVYKHRNGR